MEVIYESEKGFKSGPIVITFAEGFYCECKTFLLVVKNGFSNAVISFGDDYDSVMAKRCIFSSRVRSQSAKELNSE